MPSHADFLAPLAAKMAEEPFKLVIMDSICANFRVDYSASTAWAGGAARLCCLIALLTINPCRATCWGMLLCAQHSFSRRRRRHRFWGLP